MKLSSVVKWTAAGVLALGTIPAIGLARQSHASLPAPAITVTPIGESTAAVKHSARPAGSKVKSTRTSHRRHTTGAKSTKHAKTTTGLKHSKSHKAIASHSRASTKKYSTGHVKATSAHKKSTASSKHSRSA